MEVKVELNLGEAEISRINPQPGEVLFFQFKGEMFQDYDVHEMGRQLRTFFPNNKVVVMTIPPEHEIQLTVVANQDTVEPKEGEDCSKPTQYCNNCNCGKKESFEAKKEFDQMMVERNKGKKD